jgi:hypothetical protein
VTVPSGRIVERLDVFRDRRVGDRAILVDLLLDVLLLEAAEKRLSDGVIPAIASTAHTGYQPIGSVQKRCQSQDPGRNRNQQQNAEISSVFRFRYRWIPPKVSPLKGGCHRTSADVSRYQN